MTQNWIHTNLTLNGSTAAKYMRFGRSISVSLCENFGLDANYQPKLVVGLDRTEKQI